VKSILNMINTSPHAIFVVDIAHLSTVDITSQSQAVQQRMLKIGPGIGEPRVV
jgi:hypothetical protein